MSEERKRNLFKEDEENAYSLDDQDISLDEEDIKKPQKREKRFGVGNLIMLVIILVLASTTVYLMLCMQNKNEPSDALSQPQANESLSLESNEPTNNSTSSNKDSNEDISLPSEESSNETSSPEASPEDHPPAPTFHGMIQNNMGYTYLYYGIGIEQFNGSDKTLKRYTDAIDAIRLKLPENTNVYHLPIPTHIGYLYEKIDINVIREDDFYNASQKDFIAKLAATQNENITVIDVYQTLYDRYQAGDKLYFNTDANWTSDAAYFAYRSFCEAIGVNPAQLELYAQHSIENFLGSFYRATEHEELKNNADTFLYYTNEFVDACTLTVYNNGTASKKYTLCNNAVSSTAAYLTYLGTNAGHFKIDTPCSENRKLLVIGDGSIAAMIPYLVNHYSEIHYIDVANYNGTIDTFLAEYSVDDVLFASYLTNAVKGDYPSDYKTFSGSELQ